MTAVPPEDPKAGGDGPIGVVVSGPDRHTGLVRTLRSLDQEVHRVDPEAEGEVLTGFRALLYPLQKDNRGLRLLSEIRSAAPAVPILAILPEADRAMEAEAILAGADEILAPPLRRRHLAAVLGELRRRERSALRLELKRRYGHLQLVSLSPRMRRVYEQVLHVALSRSTVLISGESGTGKELIARAVHFNSPRRDGPFVAVNCGAIPETIIESELFGHQRGAFTGAVESTRGKFEQASGGTLYLDEIGDMSLATQVKLLRALEEGEVTRVGGSSPTRVDNRIVTATNADLERLVAEGRFRDDLYFRLNVVLIDLPSLRERREDIPLLTSTFLREACETNNLLPKEMTPEVVDILQAYHWPGNVRELKNLLEGLVVMTPARTIRPKDLPPHFRHISPRGTGGPEGRFNLKALEGRTIRAALEEAHGNRREAAALLGISERTLYRKLADTARKA